MNEGAKYMEMGLSIGLYPEGTRNHTDQLLPFKKGGYRMAKKSNSPIMLVAATGFDDIFENNKPPALRKRHVIVEFSEPMYPNELDKEECNKLYDEFPNMIQNMLDSHKK